METNQIFWKSILCDSSRIAMDRAAERIASDKLLMESALALALTEKGVLAQRASRAVSIAIENNPEKWKQLALEILDKMQNIKNESIRFHFMRIFTFLDYFDCEETIGEIFDLSMRALDENLEKAAIKVYAIEIIKRTALKIPELKNISIAAIKPFILSDKISIKSRAKNSIKELGESADILDEWE